MKFKIKPIEMISAPNSFVYVTETQISDQTSQTIWFQIFADDVLGERRYVPATGATLKVVFPRSASYVQNNFGQTESTVRSIEKTPTQNASDKSLYSVMLTQADIAGILSGSVKFTFVESGVTYNWTQDWFVKKV